MKHNSASSVAAADRPWLTLYSAPEANATGNAASWYRSRANYVVYADVDPTANSEIIMYVGQNPSNSTACQGAVFPASATFKQLVLKPVGQRTDYDFNPTTRTTFGDNEVLHLMALSSNSGSAAGAVDIDVLEAGWCFATENKKLELVVSDAKGGWPQA